MLSVNSDILECKRYYAVVLGDYGVVLEKVREQNIESPIQEVFHGGE